MPIRTIAPFDVVLEARQWLGVPWRHQGRTRAGIDCAGFVVKVAHALGQTDYDTTSYGRRAHGQEFVRHFQAGMDALRIVEAQPGDVLVFADLAYPCRCGILSDTPLGPHLLHAHVTRRKAVEEPYAGEWPATVRFAFRFRGLQHATSVPEKAPVPAGDGASRQTIISGDISKDVRASTPEHTRNLTNSGGIV